MGEHRCWSQVWRVKVPQRICFFMWLALRNRLMTNANRVVRGFTDDPSCLVCGTNEETVDHILCRCPVAPVVWRKFPAMNDYELFNKDINDRIDSNIYPRDTTRDEVWLIVFATTIWWLWKWRNSRCFERSADIPLDQLGFILAKVGLIKKAMQRVYNCGYKMIETKQLFL